jgi:type II secretory pathway component PulJ
MNRRVHQPGGFTSVELLLVLALSALILGGAVVTYGTLVRSQPSASSVVTVPLGLQRMQNFYGSACQHQQCGHGAAVRRALIGGGIA